MFNTFFRQFKEKVSLNLAEQELIQTYLIAKNIGKKQFLLQEGDTCKYIIFVEHGALRSYILEDKGTEQIVQFAVEGWTIADLYSFLTGEPSAMNIDALENTQVTLISKSAHLDLLTNVPKYETYFRQIITNAYIALQKRHTATVATSLEEQYHHFISTYPDIANRVPQHMIASYMGLTPSTISRLRKRIASGK